MAPTLDTNAEPGPDPVPDPGPGPDPDPEPNLASNPKSDPDPELVCGQHLPEPELDAGSRAAFDTAFENIRAFHAAQQSPPLSVETMPGVTCRRVTRPISERFCSRLTIRVRLILRRWRWR